MPLTCSLPEPHNSTLGDCREGIGATEGKVLLTVVGCAGKSWMLRCPERSLWLAKPCASWDGYCVAVASGVLRATAEQGKRVWC